MTDLLPYLAAMILLGLFSSLLEKLGASRNTAVSVTAFLGLGLWFVAWKRA